MIQGRFLGAFVALTLFTIPAIAKTFPAVPGEYVVKLKQATSTMNVNSVARALGAEVRSVVNAQEGLLLISRSVLETRDSALQTMSAHPMVEYAEPNYIYRLVGGVSRSPNDAEFGRLWGLSNTGQIAEGDGGNIQGQAGVDIDALKAWPIETGSENIVVAVIDTGVKWNHPDLVDNIYTNLAELNGVKGVDDDQNGCVDDIHGCDFASNDGDPMDGYGHGTHVSGTIGATGDNGQGVVGVAWKVKILPIRFLGDDGGGTLANAIKSIDYATAMKVNIMSNSWGGGGFSQALMDSIGRAKDAGILFVAAAGNSSNNNDKTPEYPCSYELDNVISVAAVDPRGNLADFSNFGRSKVHIAAPGVNILSYTMKGLESWSGTSMATPHVSGVAALLMAQRPDQSYLTIKDRILTSARPIPGLRNRVAHGLVNAYFALTDQTAPVDPNDPFNWLKTSDTAATQHPYGNNINETFTFTVPGAQKIAVYFSNFDTEKNFDKVVFKDAKGKVYGSMSGQLGEAMGPIIDGDTVVITFTSDNSVVSYGFDIGGIAFQN